MKINEFKTKLPKTPFKYITGAISEDCWELPDGKVISAKAVGHARIMRQLGYTDYYEAFENGLIRISYDHFLPTMRTYYTVIETNQPFNEVRKRLMMLCKRVVDSPTICYSGEGSTFRRWFWDGKKFNELNNKYNEETRMYESKNPMINESYSAYVLNNKSRSQLLTQFPPKYSKVIAHHITVKFGLSKEDRMPKPASIKVVGYADDGKGLEAAVVSVNGRTNRPDGSTYHITLSLGPGRKPVESNNLVAAGWKEITPFDIEAKPEIL